jgi:hypothetical protein
MVYGSRRCLMVQQMFLVQKGGGAFGIYTFTFVEVGMLLNMAATLPVNPCQCSYLVCC